MGGWREALRRECPDGPMIGEGVLPNLIVDTYDELRSANLAAATRMALLSALVDAINVGVILVDRDLLIARWNKEATRVTTSRRQLTDKKLDPNLLMMPGPNARRTVSSGSLTPGRAPRPPRRGRPRTIGTHAGRPK
jgi:PAS domain-containing protein